MPSFLGEPPSGPEVVSSPHPELEDPFAAMEREVQSAMPSGFGFGSSTGDMFSGVRCECSLHDSEKWQNCLKQMLKAFSCS